MAAKSSSKNSSLFRKGYGTQVVLIVIQAVLVTLLSSASVSRNTLGYNYEDPSTYLATRRLVSPVPNPENDKAISYDAKGGEEEGEEADSIHIPTTSTTSTMSLIPSSPAPSNNSLQIAWLMSFPNSGTSYTLQLVRSISQAQIATNYASMKMNRWNQQNKTLSASQLVFSDQPEGPFWGTEMGTGKNSTSLPYPTHFVLTKTHCGAPCMWCPPEDYVKSWHYFRGRCARADKLVQKRHTRVIQKATYPTYRVKRIVHLIRDPFDNVVSRFRFERSNHRSATNYSDTRQGFRSYCRRLNREFLMSYKRAKFFDEEVFKRLAHVPCFADFIRFAEWHNFAFITQHDMGIDSLVLHYNDYEPETFDDTVQRLATFLEFSVAPATLAIFTGSNKTYRHYFTAPEQYAALKGMKEMMLNLTWQHLERYVHIKSFSDQDSEEEDVSTKR